jgi:hypothetical protein
MPLPSKPLELPEWASGGGAPITDPSSSEKQAGWSVGALPPAEYFNWWQKLVWNWTQWLNSLTDQVLTWTAAQTFNDTITLAGSNPSSSAPQLNTLHPNNVTKVHALIVTDGVGGVSVVDGFNVASVAINNTNYVRVTFAQALTTTKYTVQVTAAQRSSQANSVLKPSACNYQLGYVDFTAHNVSTDTQVNMTTNAHHWNITINGQQ